MEALLRAVSEWWTGGLGAARLAFDPLVPVWTLAALILAAVILWGIYVGNRGPARLLRAVALSLVALALAQPILVREKREMLKDVVILVVDRSQSQRLARREAETLKAAQTLETRLAALGGLEVKRVEVADDPDGTKLFAATEAEAAAIGAQRLAGTLLLTDGQVHDLPEEPATARRFGPIHGLIVGDPRAGDRRLTILQAPQFGLVGQNTRLEVQVDDLPESSNSRPGRARIRMRINDGRSLVYTIRTGEPQILSLRLDRRGPNVLSLSAEPGPAELTLANNEAALSISGVRDRLRVLLVTGAPYPGGRVWRNLLRSDPAVDLVHFTILRPPDKQDATPTEELSLIPFPTRELFEEKLSGFDLIIFDRYTRDEVLSPLYFENINRHVEKGGALLVVAGPSYAGERSLSTTPLAAILPTRPNGRVSLTRFRPVTTPAGRKHPVTRGLEPEPEAPAWGQWNLSVGAEVISGRSLLATPEGAPLLALADVERGRAAILLSDQIWLWARGYDGGGPHAELMRRVSHWLMKEPELEAERLSASSDGQSILVERLTVEDRVPELTAESPSGRKTQIALGKGDLAGSEADGRYEARIPAGELGLWRLRSGALATQVAVGPPNPRELAALTPDSEALAPAVRASGGGIFPLGAAAAAALPELRRVDARANAAGDGWLGLPRRNAFAVRETEAIALVPGPLLAVLLIGILLFAWRREGR